MSVRTVCPGCGAKPAELHRLDCPAIAPPRRQEWGRPHSLVTETQRLIRAAQIAYLFCLLGMFALILLGAHLARADESAVVTLDAIGNCVDIEVLEEPATLEAALYALSFGIHTTIYVYTDCEISAGGQVWHAPLEQVERLRVGQRIRLVRTDSE